MKSNKIIKFAVGFLLLIALAVSIFSYTRKANIAKIKAVSDHSDSVVYRDRYITGASDKAFDSIAIVAKQLQETNSFLKSKTATLSKENAVLKQAFNEIPDTDTGKKLAACENLITGYESEIKSYIDQIYSCDSLHKLKDTQIANRQSLILVKNATIDSLYTDNKKLADMAIKSQPTWWNRNSKWFIGGAALMGGFYLGHK